LPSTGYDSNSTEHTVQVSDSQVLGTKAVNEIRFHTTATTTINAAEHQSNHQRDRRF